MKNLKIIYKIIRPTRKYIFVITFLAVLESIEMILFPYVIKRMIDNIATTISQKQSLENALFSMMIIAIVLISLLLLGDLNSVVKSYYNTKLETLVRKLIRVKLFRHLTSLSIDFFENEKIGRTISKISRGMNRTSMLINNLSNWLLSQIISFVMVVVIFFFVNAYIGIIALFVSIIYAFTTYKMIKTLSPHHKKINKRSYEVGGREVEVLSNIHTVRLFSKEESEADFFEKENKSLAEMSIYRAKKRSFYSIIRSFLADSLRVSAILIAGFQAIRGRMTAGDIFLVYSYSNYIAWPLNNFSWIYDEFEESMRSIDDIVRLLKKKSKIIDIKNAKKLERIKGEVEFKNISFKYKKGEKVFPNLSFKVKAGESIALVGPSGVGKTTITKLITRLYDPDKGKILLDSCDIKKVKQDSLRKNIGVVMQNTVLFNDTIKNNIKYGVKRASQKQIEEVAKIANIHDFIKNLPKGYNTLVGERGIKLSGGEAQRVAIARAVLKNPPIIILDEATSSLDSESEKLVQDALWKLIKGRTTFIIAHRLSTVMKADEIFVLDKGKIIERGNHKKLIKKEGLYKYLFEIQSGLLFVEKEVEV